MFEPHSKFNNDNRLVPYIKLQEKATEYGYYIATYDLIFKLSANDIYLSFSHHPRIFNRVGKKIKWENRILIAQEPLGKINFKKSSLKLYAHTLTWNENIIDGNRVKRIKAYPITKATIEWIPVENRKFLTNISINKTSHYKGELYSERLKTIHLAEQLFPGEFDHWGIGWNSPKTFLQKIGLKKYDYIPSYKGSLKEKYETLKQYKFSICYENTGDLRGNISEKIFDCFQCGVIPLYWGAPDVLKYIPAETFIWRENFRSNEEMLRFIKSMSNDNIALMIEAIRTFIGSEKMNDFWESTYIGKIVDVILSIPKEDV